MAGRGEFALSTTAALVAVFVGWGFLLSRLIFGGPPPYCGNVLLGVLVVGLVGGIMEEIVFRGWIQQWLIPRFGPFWGVYLTAILFGIAHVEPARIIHAFILGAYLGVIAHQQGTLRTAILCHVTYNSLAVILG